MSTHVTQKDSQPGIISSVTRGSLKIVQAGSLAVGGVFFICLGLGGAYLTSEKIKEFYFDKQDAENTKEYAGYSGFPGFETSCKWFCDNAHMNLGWPSKNTTFCESMAHKPFSKQEGAFAAASLVSSMGLSSICYLTSLYSFLGGLSLIGRSIEVFTSIL